MPGRQQSNPTCILEMLGGHSLNFGRQVFDGLDIIHSRKMALKLRYGHCLFSAIAVTARCNQVCGLSKEFGKLRAGLNMVKRKYNPRRLAGAAVYTGPIVPIVDGLSCIFADP